MVQDRPYHLWKRDRYLNSNGLVDGVAIAIEKRAFGPESTRRWMAKPSVSRLGNSSPTGQYSKPIAAHWHILHRAMATLGIECAV
jgi:hypothetical protein